MFSFWSRSSAANGTNEQTPEIQESTGSASPPPASTVTEPTPAPPKPKKPRKSTKKSLPAPQDAPDASAEAKETNGTKAGTATLDELKQLVAHVPPKALHHFLMERLDVQKPGKTKKRANANVFPTLQNDFPILSAFFNGLEAPPKLHCLRCHSDYFAIENGPRACVKEHDDDSAVIKKSAASIHYTFWGCCGQTVEGDGDQGPPTGWCYEGPHTTDREEARYRQDGTEEDDKLGDCAKLRCGQAPRKRKRASSVNSDSDEDVPITALEPRERHARRKSDVRGRSKSRLRELASDEDIVMSDATVEKPKAKGRGRQSKKSEAAAEETKKKEETPEVSAPPKGRGRAAGAATGGGGRGRAAKKGDDEAAKETAATTSAKATEPAKETKKTAAKRRKTEKE